MADIAYTEEWSAGCMRIWHLRKPIKVFEVLWKKCQNSPIKRAISQCNAVCERSRHLPGMFKAVIRQLTKVSLVDNRMLTGQSLASLTSWSRNCTHSAPKPTWNAGGKRYIRAVTHFTLQPHCEHMWIRLTDCDALACSNRQVVWTLVTVNHLLVANCGQSLVGIHS